MKQIKRIMAFALALVLTLAMSITVFADDPSTASTVEIKVTNIGEGANLSYVQIIQADQTTPTGWAFKDDTIAGYFTNAFSLTDNEATNQQKAIWMLIMREAADKGATLDTTKLTIPSGTSAATAAQIAVALDKVKQDTTLTTTALDVNNGTATAKVENPGVYAIKATEKGYTYKEMAAYVGFGEVNGTYPTLTGAEIKAKKSKDGIDSKESSDPDKVVAIGDIVEYTVKAQVPYFDPSEQLVNKTFKILDKIEGATYYLSGDGHKASVTVEGYTGTTTFTIVPDSANTSFTVDLTELIDNANTYAGNTVTINYTAKVTAVTVTNTASVTRGSVEEYGGKGEEKLFTGQITLTKYEDDGKTGLAKAEFELTKDGSNDALKFTEGNQKTDGTRVYTYDPANGSTTLVTGTNGKLIVEGLDVNDANATKKGYHFTETKAPEGYSVNENGADATISVTGEKAAAIIEKETFLSDSKLSSLPETGGIGTTIFTVVGCLIMISAAGMYFASRRKSAK